MKIVAVAIVFIILLSIVLTLRSFISKATECSNEWWTYYYVQWLFWPKVICTYKKS